MVRAGYFFTATTSGLSLALRLWMTTALATLRRCDARNAADRDGSRGKVQEFTADKFHGALLLRRRSFRRKCPLEGAHDKPRRQPEIARRKKFSIHTSVRELVREAASQSADVAFTTDVMSGPGRFCCKSRDRGSSLAAITADFCNTIGTERTSVKRHLFVRGRADISAH
jgi:hypothetical protein